MWPKLCAKCGPRSDVRVEPTGGPAWIVYCNNCSGGEWVTSGRTREEAIEQWDFEQEEAGMPDDAPVCTACGRPLPEPERREPVDFNDPRIT